MSAINTSELAAQIAQQLVKLQDLEKQKLFTQRRIEGLKEELQAKIDELNNIDQEMRTIKYEITKSLNEKPVELKVVGK
jgi:hypothetical protein